MNNQFVFKGVMVFFDKTVGWFFNDKNGGRFYFDTKEECLNFISSRTK